MEIPERVFKGEDASHCPSSLGLSKNRYQHVSVAVGGTSTVRHDPAGKRGTWGPRGSTVPSTSVLVGVTQEVSVGSNLVDQGEDPDFVAS